jgi:hypothetical protein
MPSGAGAALCVAEWSRPQEKHGAKINKRVASAYGRMSLERLYRANHFNKDGEKKLPIMGLQ